MLRETSTPVSAATKLTLLLVSSLTVMAGAAVAPALVPISEHFVSTGGEPMRVDLLAKLILTLPGLFIAVWAPLSGWILDRFGRRPVLLVSLILYGLAGTSGLWLPTLEALLVGRALLGIATAGVMTASTTLIGDYLDGPQRARFIGFQSTAMSVGGIGFILTSGLLAGVGWRWPFVIYGVALLFIPLAITTIREQPRRQPTANTPVARWPMATFLAVSLTCFFGVALFYLTPTQAAYLTADLGYDSTFIQSLVIVASTVGATTAAASYGWQRSKLGFKPLFAIAFAVWTVGYGLAALSPDAGGLPILVIGMLLSGFGSGYLMPNASSWLLSAAPEAMRGRLVGGMTSFFFAGQFASPFLAKPFVLMGGERLTFAAGAVAALGLTVVFVIASMLHVERGPKTARPASA